MGNIIKYYKKLIIQMADEEAPMMEEEEEDELNKRLGDGGFMCCCCLCECTNEKTKDLSCCCFFPIRCGVLFIGIFILCLTLFVFLEIFYQLLNDDIHWWFVLVGVVLAATLVVSSLSLLSSSPRTMRAAEENFSPPAYLSLSELLLRPSGLPATSYSFTRRIPLSLEMMVLVSLRPPESKK